MWNPLKALMGMFTPYVNPMHETVFCVNCEGENMAYSVACRHCHNPIRVEDPRKPLSKEDKAQISSFHNGVEVEPPVPANKVCLNPGESRPFNPNEFKPVTKHKVGKRKVSRNTRRMNGKGHSQSHTSYGHDEGPSCNSPSPSPSPSSDPVCGGGE